MSTAQVYGFSSQLHAWVTDASRILFRKEREHVCWRGRCFGLGHPLGAAAGTHGREEEAWLQAPIPEINQTWKPSGWRGGRAADGPEAPSLGRWAAGDSHLSNTGSTQQPICPWGSLLQLWVPSPSSNQRQSRDGVLLGEPS